MAVLTPQTCLASGITVNYNQATDTFEIVNDTPDSVVIVIYCVGGMGIPVTIYTGAKAAGKAIADIDVTMNSGEWLFFGPFPREVFNDSNDRIYMETVAGFVKVGAIKVLARR